MAAIVAWGRIVFVGPSGLELGGVLLAGTGRPDLDTVDLLARTQLLARRLGGCVRLRDTAPELEELLVFLGLRREVGGEPEGGEEVGVEEGVELGDPPV